MRASKLIDVLNRIRQLYLAAGTPAPAADFQKLIDVLGARPEREVSDLVAEITQSLNQPKRKTTKATAKARASALPLNAAAIVRYVGSLKNVGANQEAFDSLFSRLKSDKELRLAEITEIAHQYSGGVTKYKTVAAAHTEISKTFVRQARFANKLA